MGAHLIISGAISFDSLPPSVSCHPPPSPLPAELSTVTSKCCLPLQSRKPLTSGGRSAGAWSAWVEYGGFQEGKQGAAGALRVRFCGFGWGKVSVGPDRRAGRGWAGKALSIRDSSTHGGNRPRRCSDHSSQRKPRNFYRNQQGNPGWETPECPRCRRPLIPGSSLKESGTCHLSSKPQSSLTPPEHPSQSHGAAVPRPSGPARTQASAPNLRKCRTAGGQTAVVNCACFGASLSPSRKQASRSNSGFWRPTQEPRCHLCQNPRPQQPERTISFWNQKTSLSGQQRRVHLVIAGAVSFGCLPLPVSSHPPLSAHLSRVPSKHHLPLCPCKPKDSPV